MPIPFLTSLDLHQNELLRAVLQNLATPPSGPVAGQVYFDTNLGYGRIWDGSQWQRLAPEFLSDLAAAQADLDLNNFKLVNVAAPTAADDAANKSYVDSVASGLDLKDSVRVATTADITLSGEQTIDGVTTSADRVLVKDQSTASENGIYVTGAGAWTRSTDFDEDSEVTAGAFTFVEEGATYADSGWVVSSDGTITVGTDAIAWSQFSGAGQITAGDGLTKTGNVLDVGAGNGLIANADDIEVDFGEVGDVVDVTPDAGASAGVLEESARADHRHDLPAGAPTTDLDDTTTNAEGAAASVSRSDHTHAVTSGAGGFARFYKETITGNASATEFTITHSLGEAHPIVQVIDSDSPIDTVFVDVERTDANNVLVRFAVAPANAKDYVVSVTG